jgi:DNA-binding transcriptional MerR regulator
VGDVEYSIGELARLTGVSVRTVRFYVGQGLIDPPAGRGPGRHYRDTHVRQIVRVRELQRQGLTLDRAAAALQGRPAAPPIEEPIERELVSRFRIGNDVWLEVGPAADIPTSQQLREIVDMTAAVKPPVGVRCSELGQTSCSTDPRKRRSQ